MPHQTIEIVRVNDSIYVKNRSDYVLDWNLVFFDYFCVDLMKGEVSIRALPRNLTDSISRMGCHQKMSEELSVLFLHGVALGDRFRTGSFFRRKYHDHFFQIILCFRETLQGSLKHFDRLIIVWEDNQLIKVRVFKSSD